MITPTAIRDASEPDQVLATLHRAGQDLESAGGAHGNHSVTDVRMVSHLGHEIVIRTSYEITVDDVPFDVGLVVADDGHVHYHGLPTSGFASAVDLVRTVIDVFGGADVTGDARPGHVDEHHDGVH